jgi:hypothetical protein
VAWGWSGSCPCPGETGSRHASTTTPTAAYRKDDERLKREISISELGKKRDKTKIKGVAAEAR